ncbi:hypothetical protein [Rhodoligotrophos ferricapiens]|uniref:hypothetical protein n=1 Tax=Rhodoligotrophos ferricapiens TaxID=3069264 RepID=UPI00315D92FB
MSRPLPSICILYIALGSYDMFWEGFHRSMEASFLPGYRKHYIVFTDHPPECFAGPEITIINKQRRGWPYDSLMRFHFFNDAAHLIRQFDFVFFLNANVEVRATIGPEILPHPPAGLVAALHWAFVDKDPVVYPYERRLSSTASIPFWKGRRYFTGGMNGGTTEAFLRMSEDLAANIDADLRGGVIAKWHDESHLNAYLLDKPVLELPPSYFRPDKRKLTIETKIFALNKEKFGGLRNIRGMTPRQPLFEQSLSLQDPVLWALRAVPSRWRRAFFMRAASGTKRDLEKPKTA